MEKTGGKSSSRISTLLALFGTFFKIGAFTFGGGYAMIALLEDELVVKKGWLTREEFLDMAAIAESTPGPVAVNSATYIGYKLCGVGGAAAATVAVSLPSFVIIYVISLFFEQFVSLALINAAFKGIEAGVIYLIFSAGLRMLKSIEKSRFNMCVFAAVGCTMAALSVLDISVSSVIYILLAGAAGVAVWLWRSRKGGQ